MTRSSRVLPGIVAMAAGVTLFHAPSAYAGDVEACLSAADKAQQLRDDGKFRGAREQMTICTREVCPGPIKRDCGEWLTQLDATAPTIVLSARDGGTDITDVNVTMDGAVVSEKLDGRPVLVDIGTHTFKFTYQGAEKTQTVVISAGQRTRAITAQFGSESTATPGQNSGGSATVGTEERGGPSALPFIIGGLGVAALGSWAYFGLTGNSERSDMESPTGCKPNCEQSKVDGVKTDYLIADISLGVGVVALGVATYLFLSPSKPAPKPAAAEEPQAKIRLDFGPTRGGAAGGISGTF